MPSSYRMQASFNHGTKNRLTTNPGLSLQTITTFPIALQYCTTALIEESEVDEEGMTSTSLFFAG